MFGGGGGFNAGTVFAKLGAQFDDSGFDRWEKEFNRAERMSHDPIEAKAGLDVQTESFKRYEKNINQADRANDQIGKSNKRLGGTFGGVWGKAGAAFAVVGGTAAVISAGKKIIGTYSDINESLTKNEQLFGDQAKRVEAFSKTSATALGLSQKATLEYTGTFGNLFRALGQTEKAAADNSMQLTQLASDMASFNNTSVEDALEAIRSGLVGETEPLRRYGVNMNDATLKTEAMKLAKKGLIDESKATAQVLDPETKAMAAQALITKQTAQAHGDFAKTQDGLSNQTKILGARLTDLAGQMGEKLYPAAQSVVTTINDLLQGKSGDKNSPVSKVFDGLGKVAEDNKKSFESLRGSAGSLWNTIKRAGSGIKQAFSEVFGGRSGTGRDIRSIISQFLKLEAAIYKFATGLLAKLVKPATQALRGLMQIVRGVVRIIAGLLKGDFKKAWEGVKDIFSGAWKLIMGVLKMAVTQTKAILGLLGKVLLKAFDLMWDGAKAIFRAGVRGIVGAVKAAPGLMADAGRALARGLLDGVKALPGLLADAGGWVAEKIRSGVAGLWKEFYSLGGWLLGKIKDGIMGAIGGIASVGKSLVSKIKSGVGGAVSIPFKLVGSGDPPAGSMARGWKTVGTKAFAKAFEKKYGLHYTSGYRDPARNKAAGGVSNSNHMKGTPSNPGAIDMVGSMANMEAAAAEARRLGVPEVLVHDAGSGMHLHLGFYADGGRIEGGRVGPQSGGWRAFIAGEGAKDEWVISQEGNRSDNVGWAVEALQTLTGKQVGLFKKGKGKKKAPKPKLSKKNAALVRSAGRKEKGLARYERQIQNLEKEYDILDRKVGDGDESDFMVEHEDGSITVDETKRSQLQANLKKLIDKRQDIYDVIKKYRNAVRMAIKRLRKAIAKLEKALKAAAGKRRSKERAGYKETIADYKDRIKDLIELGGDPAKGNSLDGNDLGYELQDNQIDLDELWAEYNEWGDAKGSPPPDNSSGGGGGGSEGGTATAEEIAAAAQAQLASFNASRADLFSSFGSNFTPAGRDPFEGTAGSGAGMRFYGGASAPAGAAGADGGTTINIENNYQSGPGDPHTWSQQQRFEIEAAF